MDKKGRKWLLLISIPAIIAFFIVLFFNILELSEHPAMIWYRPLIIGLRGSRPIPIISLVLPSALLILAVIPLSYYFLSKRLEEKLEMNIKIISKLINKKDSIIKMNSKNNTDKSIILKFFNPNERKVVEMLIKKKGEILQSEISRTGGMTKLKTHRAVKDLERKGIVTIEKHGKTNRIILTKDVKNTLLK
ncbi:MAG: hypothetical protein QXQ40_01260 [Candidatus Aenigmatarchaeota archaeon]